MSSPCDLLSKAKNHKDQSITQELFFPPSLPYKPILPSPLENSDLDFWGMSCKIVGLDFFHFLLYTDHHCETAFSPREREGSPMATLTAPHWFPQNVPAGVVFLREELQQRSRSPGLLERMRDIIRAHHYSSSTEKAYVIWARRFILFHNKRHPAEMGEPEINAFLSDLAVKKRVSSSTQNQALSALLFLYRYVLGREIGELGQIIRARRSQRIPTV